MADNLAVTAGTGSTIGMDEVIDGTLGTVKVGFGKIMDGTLDSTNKLIVSAAGAAKVDGSAVTQPVSLATNTPTLQTGSTTAVTQATGTNLHAVLDSGTLTTVSTVTNLSQLGGVAVAMNTGVRSTGTQRVTIATDDLVPISAASLPLPTGASTAAKQPALGTAGLASADVLSVQGVASMTALKVDGSAVTQPVSLVSTTVTGTVAVTESGTWTVGSSTATGSTVPANAFYNGVNPQTALPTAATAGNLTGATADKFGRAVVLPGTIRDLVGTQTTTISASTAETTVVTAAASTFNDLTALVISNTSATAARLDFRDTTGGSILFSIYVPAGDVRGVAFNRPVPQTSVNTNWTTQSSASITDLRVYAVFDKNK